MADNGKSFLVDTTKCIGCRSCQVACKQWYDLAAEEKTPGNWGTYENPPDLSRTQWMLVTFHEAERADGTLAWNFARQSCRHCIDAPCKQVAQQKDSIIIDDETGAVVFTEKTKNESYQAIRESCPYDVPRQGPDGQLWKCKMCVDRVHGGELPACVKACPTGGLSFGDRAEVLAAAEQRLEAVRAQLPNANVLDRREVRVLILLGDRASMYKMRGGVKVGENPQGR
jgi:formate dehydrogenase iron-sulfur subunit